MRRKREADSNVGLGHESRRRCGAVIESGYSQEGTFQRLKTAPYLFRLYEQDRKEPFGSPRFGLPSLEFSFAAGSGGLGCNRP